MGCHTWFKTKSKYSIEELRQKWINKQALWIGKWTQYCKNPENETRKHLFSEYSQEQFEQFLAIYKRQYRMVKNGTIKRAFINHLSETDEGTSYIYYNDTIFVETKGLPHDIFRIGGYPEDKLLSYNETIEFCAKNNIKLSLSQITDLQRFWIKYPKGLIEFG